MKGNNIIRKTDFIGWDKVDPARHDGIVTLVLELDPNRRRIKLGFAFCSRSDRFNRKVGLKYAMERLRVCPIEIPVLYQADHAAGEVLKALCIRDWGTLEQVTALEIHTEAWRRAVPGWAKKWYSRVMCPEPLTGVDKVAEALEDWGGEIIAEFRKAGAFATAQCFKNFGVKMKNDLLDALQQGLPPGAMKAPESPKDKVH